MKAVIHIGMMKTGTTSIQEWLRSNRAALEAEGVHSNRGPRVYEKIGHVPLGNAVFQTALYELGADEKSLLEMNWMCNVKNKRRKRINNEKSAVMAEELEKFSGVSGTFIYSHEGIFKFCEIQMVALEKYLSRFFDDIIYVVYIRNALDFLLSMYNQKILRSPIFADATQGYSEFLKYCASNPAPYGRESSYGNLLNWHKVLGDKLRVRLLESDWLIEGDLIEDFASLVGVAAFEKPGRRNESLAAEYIEYFRFLNLELWDKLPRENRNKALDVLLRASSGKPKLAVSDEQARLLRDIHREQEERIRTRFFPDRQFLFSPKFHGSGVAPVPLTERRKTELESVIQEKLEPEDWPPPDLVRQGGKN